MTTPPDKFFKLAFGDPARTDRSPFTRDARRRGSPEEAEGDIPEAVTLPRNRELFMTIADKYRNEGHTEGVLNDRREMLVRLLTKKFGLTNEERRLIQNCDDLDRLAAAIDEILGADSKEQVLAELRR